MGEAPAKPPPPPPKPKDYKVKIVNCSSVDVKLNLAYEITNSRSSNYSQTTSANIGELTLGGSHSYSVGESHGTKAQSMPTWIHLDRCYGDLESYDCMHDWEIKPNAIMYASVENHWTGDLLFSGLPVNGPDSSELYRPFEYYIITDRFLKAVKFVDNSGKEHNIVNHPHGIKG